MSETAARKPFDHWLAVAVTAITAFLVCQALLTRSYTRELRDATQWVDHSHEIIEAVQTVQSLVGNAEGGQRGYLLTGDPLYLDPYHEAVEGVGTAIEQVLALTRDNVDQMERITALRKRAQARLAILAEGIEAFADAAGSASELAGVAERADRGKVEMDALNREAEAMIRVERDLLRIRDRRVAAVYQRMQLVTLLSAAFGLLVLALVATRLRQQIDRRVRDAETIADQASRWQVTLASIGDAVITTDRRGCCVFLNSEAERLTGWSTADALGYPLEQVFRIFNESTGARLESPAARALREGKPVGLANHTVLEARSGERRPIDDSAAPIRDSAGDVSGVVLVFRDVSVSYAADRDLRKLAHDLAEADRRKNEFLAMLAHELRNPLAPIRNSLQILRRTENPSELGSRSLDAIDRQSKQLVRLVDDLLDVSRISRGRIELRRSRIDLRDVVRDAVEAGRPLCEDAKQELLSELPDEALWVDGDATRLTQSLGNLINNACKYSDPGGRVTLRLGREDGFAILAVVDTGIGIARDQLAGIFDMFAQVDTSLERARGGLGIGLTLVKQFVELHGGSVEARSEGAGRGSEFILRLPIVAPPEAPPPAPTPAPGADAANASAAAGRPDTPVGPGAALPSRAPAADSKKSALRVLVVDDNADSLDSLSTLLRLLGHEARTAHDGPEALAVASEFAPEVVLLDIGLPGLNGYEVAVRLRKRDGGRARLVALTGWGQEEDRRRSAEAGFDEHLVKPIDHDELARILASVPRG